VVAQPDGPSAALGRPHVPQFSGLTMHRKDMVVPDENMLVAQFVFPSSTTWSLDLLAGAEG